MTTSRSDLTITVRASLGGYPLEICFNGGIDQLGGLVKRLEELGAEPVYPRFDKPAAEPRRLAAKRVKPVYDGDGDATCPTHRRKLSEGSYGLFCPAKAKGDEVADRKGYCGLKFEE